MNALYRPSCVEAAFEGLGLQGLRALRVRGRGYSVSFGFCEFCGLSCLIELSFGVRFLNPEGPKDPTIRYLGLG